MGMISKMLMWIDVEESNEFLVQVHSFRFSWERTVSLADEVIDQRIILLSI